MCSRPGCAMMAARDPSGKKETWLRHVVHSTAGFYQVYCTAEGEEGKEEKESELENSLFCCV